MDPRVRAAIALFEASSGRQFTIPELARAVNLSQGRLTHLFVKDIRISPSQFFRRLKFKKSKTLLETTFLTIKEIMNEVGIADKSHFAKDFKKLYGCQPTEYRRRHAKLAGYANR